VSILVPVAVSAMIEAISLLFLPQNLPFYMIYLVAFSWHWYIQDDNGNDITLLLPNSLYVPQAPMCALSPQQMAQHTASSSDGFICHGTYSTLTFSGFQCTIPCSSLNNLPIFFFTMDPSSTNTNYHPFASLLSSTSTSSDTTTNLSSVQKKLLHMNQNLVI
jgi:hypothetical protein